MSPVFWAKRLCYTVKLKIGVLNNGILDKLFCFLENHYAVKLQITIFLLISCIFRSKILKNVPV